MAAGRKGALLQVRHGGPGGEAQSRQRRRVLEPADGRAAGPWGAARRLPCIEGRQVERHEVVN